MSLGLRILPSLDEESRLVSMIESLRLSESEYTFWKNKEIEKVAIEGGFWGERLRINGEVSLLHQYEECERTGRIDNFRRVAGLIEGKSRSSRVAPDSDVYKWMEAAAYSLEQSPTGIIKEKLDEVIELVALAQDESGYINTVLSGEEEHLRWKDLFVNHELYCGGHLIQAGLAHFRATGEDKLLGVAIKWADHVCEYFGEGKHQGTCGHPEVEMALVELYRETKRKKYLKQAIYFIEQRGKTPPVLRGSLLHQDHLPVTEQTEVTGHAVRQLYLMSGLADIYMETGEEWILENLLLQWRDLATTKMSITGGLGARHAGEAFGLAYELPDRTSYNETCAAIAGFMFYWRMLLITGEASFAEAMERTLYNGVLCGVSLDGKECFYTNPLEHPGDTSSVRTFYGGNRRSNLMWDNVPCCPPNIARTLASLPNYLYSSNGEQTRLHMFAESTAEFATEAGRFQLIQKTNYPWEGKVEITVEAERKFEHFIAVRIPEWARGGTVRINEGVYPVEPGYFEMMREWRTGDKITIDLPMPVVKMAANSHLSSGAGKVALMRGPLVYCLEGVDHPGQDIFDLAIPFGTKFEPVYDKELLGGVVSLRGRGKLNQRIEDLYFPVEEVSKKETAEITAVPYFAWANRSSGALRTWLPME